MKKFEVLGACCSNCDNTAALIARKARELGVAVEVVKVTDMGEILSRGVMSTPGVIVDGTLVHAGGMPSAAQVESWVKA